MRFGELLDQFGRLKALVVGDLMLDEYIFGSATRISQEAPVMVVRQKRTTSVPGGAANVARNLRALGASTMVAGLVGSDAAGDDLVRAFTADGFDASGIVRDPARATTRKTRVLADAAHQVLRIDHEDELPAGPEAESQLLAEATRLLERADLVVLSDYLKGALTEKVVAEVIARARELGKPVSVNAKPRSLPFYRGANCLTLNRAEASEVLGLWQPLEPSLALEAAQEIRSRTGLDALVITLGEAGMAVAGPERFRVEAPKVEVYDTAGAGDTVVATVALGLAADGFTRSVFELAAQASAAVVRKVGVAVPSADDLREIRAAGA
ncbi:MAG TPA: PfkB family carbohydrate kinase [Fimbriimonadaceae bacterium]|nr:PfkB family carbohydrate kinase [Fimbriimonadaceae bacterium]